MNAEVQRMTDRRWAVETLPDTLRTQAKAPRRYGGETPAVALESCAAELEATLRKSDDTTLSLTEAARERGCSTDHLGRLVREGKIPNAGRPGAPRIARGQLWNSDGSGVDSWGNPVMNNVSEGAFVIGLSNNRILSVVGSIVSINNSWDEWRTIHLETGEPIGLAAIFPEDEFLAALRADSIVWEAY